jgi:hypothetical protein
VTRYSETWPLDVPVPTFRQGDRVWCRTAFGGYVQASVMRVQMSEGPGKRWPAVRVVTDGGSYPAGVNWPVEDVSAEAPVGARCNDDQASGERGAT